MTTPKRIAVLDASTGEPRYILLGEFSGDSIRLPLAVPAVGVPEAQPVADGWSELVLRFTLMGFPSRATSRVVLLSPEALAVLDQMSLPTTLHRIP